MEAGPVETQSTITKLVEAEPAKPKATNWTNVLLISLLVVMSAVLVMLVALFVTISGMWTQTDPMMEKVNVVVSSLFDTETGQMTLNNLAGDLNFFNAFINFVNPLGVVLTLMKMDIQSVASTMVSMYDNMTNMYIKRRDEYEDLFECTCEPHDTWVSGPDGQVEIGQEVMYTLGQASQWDVRNYGDGEDGREDCRTDGRNSWEIEHHRFQYERCGYSQDWFHECHNIKFAPGQKVWWDDDDHRRLMEADYQVILNIMPDCDDTRYWIGDPNMSMERGDVKAVYTDKDSGDRMAVVRFEGDDSDERVNVKHLLYLDYAALPADIQSNRKQCSKYNPGWKCNWTPSPSYKEDGSHKEEPMAIMGSILEMVSSFPMKPFANEFLRATKEAGLEPEEDSIRVSIDKWFATEKFHELGSMCLKWVDVLEAWDWENTYEFDDPVSGETKYTMTFNIGEWINKADKWQSNYNKVWEEYWPEYRKRDFERVLVDVIPIARRICGEIRDGFELEEPTTSAGTCSKISKKKKCDKSKTCQWKKAKGVAGCIAL